MLPATAAVLAVLAVLLAWPVPARLARAGWPSRDPLVGLLCWQAVGLAGGLAMIGALLAHGLTPWGSSLPGAGRAFATASPAGDPVRADHAVASALGVVLAAELVGVLLVSWVRVLRTRRRHRALLELVVEPGPVVDASLLAHPAPVAFCLPGARPLLVLSTGMVAELDGAQLEAVVAHERAHLRERHHLLLLPFVAWRTALPVLPAARRAHDAVRDLVEMRADDVALRSLAGPAPRRTLARAIVAAAGGGAGVPGGALAAHGAGVRARVERLLDPPAPLPAAARAAALLAAALLLLGPTALVLLPAG